MDPIRTIRNCPPGFRRVCPETWDGMAPTAEPTVRHCGRCDRPVYFCTTDAETIARARSGDCIARERPDPAGLPRLTIGQPGFDPPVTPEQAEARRREAREGGIDDAIRNAPRATRACPACGYPAPDWRTTCRVCEHEIGRVPPPDVPG